MQLLIHCILGYKIQRKEGTGFSFTVADWLVYSKVRDALGTMQCHSWVVLHDNHNMIY